MANKGVQQYGLKRIGKSETLKTGTYLYMSPNSNYKLPGGKNGVLFCRLLTSGAFQHEGGLAATLTAVTEQ